MGMQSGAKPAAGEKVGRDVWMTGRWEDAKLLNGVADVCGRYVGPTGRDFGARTSKQAGWGRAGYL